MDLSIGIRDLKNSLSEYLKRVREGDTIVVTDRGQPVARIIPVEISEGIAKLMAEGRVAWSGRRPMPPPDPIELKPGAPLASELISEDRD